MNVLIPQWGTVGVNSTVNFRLGLLRLGSSNVICEAETTASCSRVMLRCSGSEIDRMSSKGGVNIRIYKKEVDEATKDLLSVNIFNFRRVLPPLLQVRIVSVV